MGLYSGGLIIVRIFASENWGAYFWGAYYRNFTVYFLDLRKSLGDLQKFFKISGSVRVILGNFCIAFENLWKC